MNRFFSIALLLSLTSCGPHSDQKAVQQNDSSATRAMSSNKDSDNADGVKHETFNERIDTLPAALKAFIPEGYDAINTSSGDANLDGLMDRILVLRKKTEATTSDYPEKPEKRPFLLLLGMPDHSYKLAARNDNAVDCIDCGGLFGDPFTGTTIKNGYFSIELGIAGGQHWEKVITFKYDKVKGDWYLYKDHYISYKNNDSPDTDAEALIVDTDKQETPKDFGLIPFGKFDTYSDKGH